MRLFGIETEYGIAGMTGTRSIRSWSRWNWYGPISRARSSGAGITAGKIRTKTPGVSVCRDWLQDKEEDLFARLDAHRPFSFHEMKSDLVLSNGARFYNDHTHPEYSTPECRTLKQSGGPRSCRGAHRSAGGRPPQSSRLGTRSSISTRTTPIFTATAMAATTIILWRARSRFPGLVSGLLPFLASRQVIAGAGKVGIEAQESGFVPGAYQLSQRADFMETELSVDTMHNRPILNTRDEPHADGKKYRRLHLILGDANMCEYATALKVGTTQTRPGV